MQLEQHRRQRRLRRADNALFGTAAPQRGRRSRTSITGWGNRPWNQEFSASVQQQLVPRVAVDFGYFRRWYGNFSVVDNRAVGPATSPPTASPAPVDARLPSERTDDWRALRSECRTRSGAVDNFTTFADNFGKQIEHWNGVDCHDQRAAARRRRAAGWPQHGPDVDRQLRPRARRSRRLRCSPASSPCRSRPLPRRTRRS